MAHPTEGFEIGFHGALSEPITLAGAPRGVAVLIGTLTAILALGLQAPAIGIPLGLALQIGAVWMTRRDPYAFDLLRRHLRHRPFLDA
ncbi:MAG TPA: VirB3 family type IV secretion system protein [Phenylobacterium sp.]